MKTYILQKDLPNISAGNEFKLEEERYYLCTESGNSLFNRLNFNKSEVENNPEWFKLKEEKIEVVFDGQYISDDYHAPLKNAYAIRTSSPIPDFYCKNNYYHICKAIEFIINGGNSIDVVLTKYYVSKGDICLDKKYTLEDMRLCYKAGDISDLNFEDYINSLNK